MSVFMRRLPFRRVLPALVVSMSINLIVLGGVPAQAGTRAKVDEFQLEKGSGPALIATDASGRVWAPLARKNAILMMDTKRGIKKLLPLPKRSFPVGILATRSGSVYFTDVGRNLIGMIDPETLETREFKLPTPDAFPFFLVEADDGGIWFTERYGNAIGRLDPGNGKVIEVPVPTKGAQPAGLTYNGHGRLFFTENSAHQIGTLDLKTHKILEFPVPSKLKDPPYYGLAGINAEDSSTIWFAELDGRIGRAQWDEQSRRMDMKEFSLPDPSVRPGGVFVDGQKRVWFTELDGNAVSSIKNDGSGYVRYPLLSGAADPDPRVPAETAAKGKQTVNASSPKARTTRPFGISEDRQGNIWFSMQYGSAIGRIKALPEKRLDHAKHPVARRFARELILTPDDLRLEPKRSAVYLENGDTLQWTPRDQFAARLMKDAPSPDCQTSVCRSGPMQRRDTRGVLIVRPFQGAIKEFALPRRNRVPGVMDYDPRRQAYWFTKIGGFPLPRIGHLPPGEHIALQTEAGEVSEFRTLKKASSPTSLQVADNGDVWFTQQGSGALGRFQPEDRRFTDYPLPSSAARPLGIAVDDSRGRVWYTDRQNAKVGYIDQKTGKTREYDTPILNSEPSTITVDQTGNVWFDQRSDDSLVYLDPSSNKTTRYPIGKQGSRVIGVTMDPQEDERVWFLTLAGNTLGTLSRKDGSPKHFSLPSEGSFPFKMHFDSLGSLWITEVFGNRIAAFHDGSFLEFDVPTPNAMPGGITGDGKSVIRFTQQGSDKIGQIVYKEEQP